MPGSPAPQRSPQGFTTAFPYQFFANYGFRDPFFYHEIEDDFDDSVVAANRWTKTTTGNGTIVNTAGDGGLLTFTTNSSTPAAGDVASIQLLVANFAFTSGSKFFFLTRLQLADVVNPGLLVGLIQTTATPFTVVDGLYFLKASGASNNLILRSTVASVNTDLVIPTASYTLTNSVNIDIGFFVDRNNLVQAFVGNSLVGYIPQSGVGASTPQRGPDAASTPTKTAANLNVTVALQSGTATSKTMIADFVMAAKER